MMRRNKPGEGTPARAMRCFFCVFSLALILGILIGAAKAYATDISFGKHIEAVKMSCDLRLRHESFMAGSPGNRGRNRQRYRLRLGAELPLNDKLKSKLRLASGTGEQTSTNQSFDNLSSQNAVWIDQAMLEYAPLSTLRLSAGRMPNPLWVPYSADTVWDGDLSPMGFGQSVEKLVGPVNVFANALQMVADEDAGNQGDQWVFSGQLGAEFRLPLDSRLRVAGAVHEWVNETTTTRRNAGTFGQTAVNNGNRRYTSGVLQNEFRVQEITAELSFWLAKLPVRLQGTFIENTAALDSLDTPKKADKGSQIGAILGKASAKGAWEAAYFLKDVETDATVADVADADFGNGGTGRKGSILWFAYGVEDYATASVKYFMTELEDERLAPGTGAGRPNDLNRLQVDFSVKF
jgi:hypothetical protein